MLFPHRCSLYLLLSIVATGRSSAACTAVLGDRSTLPSRVSGCPLSFVFWNLVLIGSMSVFSSLCWPLGGHFASGGFYLSILRCFHTLDNLPGTSILWVLDLLLNPVIFCSSNCLFGRIGLFLFCFALSSTSSRFLWLCCPVFLFSLFLLSYL